MIKVHTDVTTTADGLDLDTEVLVAVPKGASKEIADLLCKHEIKSLLKKMYMGYPDIVEDAIQEFVSEVEEEV